MKSQNYVTALAILNALLARVSASLPQIQQATLPLYPLELPAALSVGADSPRKTEV